MSSQEATEEEVLAALTAQLKGIPRKKLVELATNAKKLQKRLALDGPQDRDQLHAWVKRELKVDIPRVAVCDGHIAPFDLLAMLYFEETNNVTAIANRGGSKTFIVAVLHYVNSTYKPKLESLTVGAVENQARRCYSHVLKLIDERDPKHLELVKDPTQTETKWKTGAVLEILPGTMNAVNGPHPQKLHLDEVELMDPDVLEEAMNMPQAKTLQDGRVIEAQIIRTSTRKRAAGMMQKLVDEHDDAIREGKSPPSKVVFWCLWETAQRVPNCQVANPELEGCDACQCHDVVKGEWEDGSPRTLRDVCQGKLARSSGWIPYSNIITTFQSVSRAVWEAQQECKRPSTQGLVVPQFARERHAIRGWDPDPEIGPIFMSVDFGGTNPHCVSWYQLVRHETAAKNLNGYELRVTEGSIVCFDEIYRSGVGNAQLAKMVNVRESAWRRRHPRFRPSYRFYDVQSKVGKLDFADADPPLRLQNFVPKDVKREVQLVVSAFEDGKFFVDAEACPQFVDEIENWHYPRKKAMMVDDPETPVDDYDHSMSAMRYFLANLRHVQKAHSQKRTAPRSGSGGHRTPMPGTPTGGGPAVMAEQNWRNRAMRPLGG